MDDVLQADARYDERFRGLERDLTRVEKALINNTRATWALLAAIVLASLTIAASVLIAVTG